MSQKNEVLHAKKNWQSPTEPSSLISSPSLDNIPDNGFAYDVELPKVSGISWSSDISFRWVYVQDIDPSSVAAASALIEKVINYK